jgi:serine/threonine protein kinase/Flp pilus assembly protein TadD
MAESRAQQAAQPAALRDLSGTSVGRFAIQARLGVGGMGEVYRAEDTKLKRPVALKRIAPHLRTDEHYRQRFLREAEFASWLSDPHIASVYDVFEEGADTFLVMEYVEGKSLRQQLGRAMPVEDFLPIALQCATALAAAHERGILHRDIKPENIMLTPAGRVKILDFGIAKRLPRADETASVESRSGTFSGTPAYMAPEVLLEKEADARSDIFSLGVVFYEALAGKHPFRADSFVATSNRILEETPAPLHSLNPDVPAQLDLVVAKMLAKDAAARYGSAAELLADLRAVAEKYPAGRPLSISRRPGGRRRLLLAGTALVAVGVAAGTVAYHYSRAPRITTNDWILMTDFTNRSGQPLFEDTVGEAFRRALEQSHNTRLVPRAQVVEAARLLGRSQVANIDPALGREICQRGNCQAVLTGEITSADSTFQIGIRLEDPWRNAPVFTEQAVFQSRAKLYPTVDKLARGFREHLGESLADIQKTSVPLAKVTTPSLEALQRYTRARNLYDTGDLDGALPLAKSAADLDPDFPMDHLLLAEIYIRLGNGSEVNKQLALALRGLDRVTERERYLIQATDYANRNLHEKAAEQYRLLTELYPDDLLAYRGLAGALWAIGHLEEAAAAERRALEISPDSTSDYNNLIITLDELNRFSEALKTFSMAQSRAIQSPLLHWGAGLAYLGQGNREAAAREFELLKQAGDYGANLASFYRASLLAHEGRLAEATQELQAGVVLGEKQGSKNSLLTRRWLLAKVLAMRGRRTEALAGTRALASQARAQADPWGLEAAGLLALELGNRRLARQLLAELDKLRSKDQGAGYIQSRYYTLKGGIELADGDAAAAVTSARAALVYFPVAYQAASVLGQAYARKRNWPEAAKAYKRYLDSQGQLFALGATAEWAAAQARLARAQAEAGQTDEALRSYDRFLKLWSGADAGLPIVEQARADRQRLSTAPPQKSVSARTNK